MSTYKILCTILGVDMQRIEGGSEQIHIHVTTEQFNFATDESFRRGISRSKYIRLLLDREMKKHENKKSK